MKSLRLRLLALTSLFLVISFAALGGVIDRSFVAALEQAQRDLLDSQIITLLAVAEPEGDSLVLPPDMPEVRLNSPGSGLYANIRRADGTVLWRSGSALALDVTPPTALPDAGQRVFARQSTAEGEVLQALTLGIFWQFDDDSSAYFALEVAESRASLDAQMRGFRGQLYAAFALISVALLVSVALVLSWLLRPLGLIEREIEHIESGQIEGLSGEYPSELSGVARNLNTLLDSEAKRATRYQQTLANLAHSLKTPLAAAQNLLAGRNDDRELSQQLDRMQDIVRYQLARPAAAGGRMVGRGSVAVFPEIIALLDGLDKVYRGKGVSAEIDSDESLEFYGDKGDLVELLGNLLDNAYKWSQSRVLVTAHALPFTAPQRKPGILLRIDDDGPGIPAEQSAAVTERGTRLDEATPGTGIGLAVAADLVGLYGGALSIESSDLGGARVSVTIPPF